MSDPCVEFIGMLRRNSPKYGSYVLDILDGHEPFSIVFRSSDIVNVLHEVLARFERAFPSFGGNEQVRMPVHFFEDFPKCRNVFSRSETPRIAKA